MTLKAVLLLSLLSHISSIHGEGVPTPYSFQYTIDHDDGGRHMREEQGDSQAVKGSYMINSPEGYQRTVNYIADENGFRAYVDSNEPGVKSGEYPPQGPEVYVAPDRYKPSPRPRPPPPQLPPHRPPPPPQELPSQRVPAAHLSQYKVNHNGATFKSHVDFGRVDHAHDEQGNIIPLPPGAPLGAPLGAPVGQPPREERAYYQESPVRFPNDGGRQYQEYIPQQFSPDRPVFIVSDAESAGRNRDADQFGARDQFGDRAGGRRDDYAADRFGARHQSQRGGRQLGDVIAASPVLNLKRRTDDLDEEELLPRHGQRSSGRFPARQPISEQVAHSPTLYFNTPNKEEEGGAIITKNSLNPPVKFFPPGSGIAQQGTPFRAANPNPQHQPKFYVPNQGQSYPNTNTPNQGHPYQNRGIPTQGYPYQNGHTPNQGNPYQNGHTPNQGHPYQNRNIPSQEPSYQNRDIPNGNRYYPDRSVPSQLLSVDVQPAFQKRVGTPEDDFHDKRDHKPYEYNYSGKQSGHKQSGDGTGKVKGEYYLRTHNGQLRKVVYEADEDGFRAHVDTNEFGIVSHKPNDATIVRNQIPGTFQVPYNSYDNPPQNQGNRPSHIFKPERPIERPPRPSLYVNNLGGQRQPDRSAHGRALEPIPPQSYVPAVYKQEPVLPVAPETTTRPTFPPHFSNDLKSKPRNFSDNQNNPSLPRYETSTLLPNSGPGYTTTLRPNYYNYPQTTSQPNYHYTTARPAYQSTFTNASRPGYQEGIQATTPPSGGIGRNQGREGKQLNSDGLVKPFRYDRTELYGNDKHDERGNAAPLGVRQQPNQGQPQGPHGGLQPNVFNEPITEPRRLSDSESPRQDEPQFNFRQPHHGPGFAYQPQAFPPTPVLQPNVNQPYFNRLDDFIPRPPGEQPQPFIPAPVPENPSIPQFNFRPPPPIAQQEPPPQFKAFGKHASPDLKEPSSEAIRNAPGVPVSPAPVREFGVPPARPLPDRFQTRNKGADGETYGTRRLSEGESPNNRPSVQQRPRGSDRASRKLDSKPLISTYENGVVIGGPEPQRINYDPINDNPVRQGKSFNNNGQNGLTNEGFQGRRFGPVIYNEQDQDSYYTNFRQQQPSSSPARLLHETVTPTGPTNSRYAVTTTATPPDLKSFGPSNNANLMSFEVKRVTRRRRRKLRPTTQAQSEYTNPEYNQEYTPYSPPLPSYGTLQPPPPPPVVLPQPLPRPTIPPSVRQRQRSFPHQIPTTRAPFITTQQPPRGGTQYNRGIPFGARLRPDQVYVPQPREISIHTPAPPVTQFSPVPVSRSGRFYDPHQFGEQDQEKPIQRRRKVTNGERRDQTYNPDEVYPNIPQTPAPADFGFQGGVPKFRTPYDRPFTPPVLSNINLPSLVNQRKQKSTFTTDSPTFDLSTTDVPNSQHVSLQLVTTTSPTPYQPKYHTTQQNAQPNYHSQPNTHQGQQQGTTYQNPTIRPHLPGVTTAVTPPKSNQATLLDLVNQQPSLPSTNGYQTPYAPYSTQTNDPYSSQGHDPYSIQGQDPYSRQAQDPYSRQGQDPYSRQRPASDSRGQYSRDVTGGGRRQDNSGFSSGYNDNQKDVRSTNAGQYDTQGGYAATTTAAPFTPRNGNDFGQTGQNRKPKRVSAVRSKFAGDFEGTTPLDPKLQKDLAQPSPYKFGYDDQHDGGRVSRQEEFDGTGKVTGFYTIEDPDGRKRLVKYIADENGFRASVITNEQGTDNQDPAQIKVKSTSPEYVPKPLPIDINPNNVKSS